MILHDVTNGTYLLVEGTAPLDAEFLCHRDLHPLGVTRVPHRFHERIRETKHQQILDGLFAEIMVDAQDLRFIEYLQQRLVQFVRTREIAAERLLDDDARPARAAGAPEPVCNRRE